VFTGVTTAAELLAAPENMRPSFLAADVSGLLQGHARPITVDGQVQCGRWRVQTRADTGPDATRDTGAAQVAGAGPASGPDADGGRENGSRRDAQLELVLTTRGSAPVIDAKEGGVARRTGVDLDALRALCAATWQASGSVGYLGGDEAAKRALSALGLA